MKTTMSIKEQDFATKLNAIKAGDISDLSELYTDKNFYIRALVAQKGFYLDELYRDPIPSVRLAVASQGGHLDILTRDSNRNVRIIANRKLCSIQREEQLH